MLTPEKITEVVFELKESLRTHNLTEAEAIRVWDVLGENIFWGDGRSSRQDVVIKMWDFANQKVRTEIHRHPRSRDAENAGSVSSGAVGKAKT